MQLITQNVDGLSPRATSSLAPESTETIHELHGSIFGTRCTSCGDERVDERSPICDALEGTHEAFERGEPRDVPVERLPHCEKCDGLLRPAVVWFGEVPKGLEDVVPDALDACDFLLVVGTSSTVRLQDSSDSVRAPAERRFM